MCTRLPLMPGSLFPRSPSPDEPVPMKHVHFTPPTPKNSRPASVIKTILRPEDVPLPLSRSSSPAPPEESSKQGKKANLPEHRKHRDRLSSNAHILSNKSTPEVSLNEAVIKSNRPQDSSTRTAKPHSSTDYTRHLVVSRISLSPNPQRAHSLESTFMGPPSTIVVSSEEPPSIFTHKGKEKDTGDDSYERTDISDLTEDRIRIQLLEAEVERLRAEVCLDLDTSQLSDRPPI
jgi:uncharacterized small protein (DUF1192 family)